MTDFLKTCSAAYWASGELPMDHPARMEAVVQNIAGTIRSWAAPENPKLCLLVDDIADRLLLEARGEGQDGCTAGSGSCPVVITEI